MCIREHLQFYESGIGNATKAKLSEHQKLWGAGVTFRKSLAVWCGIRKCHKFPGNNTAVNKVHPGKKRKKDNIFHLAQIKRSSFEPSRAVVFMLCSLSENSNIACAIGVHFQKHAQGTKLRASTVGQKPFRPNPLSLLLFFLLTSSTSSSPVLLPGLYFDPFSYPVYEAPIV